MVCRRARNYRLWFPSVSVILTGTIRGRQCTTPAVTASVTATVARMGSIYWIVQKFECIDEVGVIVVKLTFM